ncbi:hypothetical protein BGW80DRAFT_1170927 [Lactifluus volemus]|nr:hypothetical protein BGW80DRAFT_1170927 [Lactifluus volemus]
MFIAITVSLPEGKQVTHVPRFETSLPYFRHTIHELPTHTFDSFFLHPFHRPVHVKDLVGDKIAIHTKNAPIEGTFNTSSSLDITTSNAPVAVKINAFSQNNCHPTKVKVQTKNSVLFSDLSLFSTFENQTGGAFCVKTHTSNSPLEINFKHQPPDSHLKLDAHTSNSPARVHLQPAFEGPFKLKTSIFPSIVAPDLDAKDPAGLGRKRVVNVKTIGHGAGVVQGDAAWVSEDRRCCRRHHRGDRTTLSEWMFRRRIHRCTSGFEPA